MAAIGTIQLAGNANAGPVEVELNTLAERIVCRPNDFQYLGSFSATATGNGMTGQTVALPNSGLGPQIAFRNPTSIIAAVKKVTISVINTGTALTAQQVVIKLVRVINQVVPFYSVGATGTAYGWGGAVGGGNPTPPLQAVPVRLRGSGADSPIEFCGAVAFTNFVSWLTGSAQAATGAATASNVPYQLGPTSEATLADAQPINTITFAANGSLFSTNKLTLFEARAGELPLCLSANEAFVISFELPGAGVGSGQNLIQVSDAFWDELVPNW